MNQVRHGLDWTDRAAADAFGVEGPRKIFFIASHSFNPPCWTTYSTVELGHVNLSVNLTVLNVGRSKSGEIAPCSPEENAA